MLLWHRVAQVLPLLLLQLFLDLTELPSAAAWLKFNSYTALSKKRTDLRKKCPNVSLPHPQFTVKQKQLQIDQRCVGIEKKKHIINS